MSSTDGSTTPILMNKPHGKEEIISSLGAAEKAEPETEPTTFSSTFQEAVFILVIGLSQLFSVGGLGNVAYSIEQIGASLGTNSNGQMSWFQASYSLCGGVFVLVTGRLGDHFGHKYVFLFGWIWMAIWSLVCGFSHDVVLFDIARGMMGIGNGALAPNSFALLARAFPPLSVKKNIAFAFLGFCAPSGYIFGGLIGAAFGEKVTWRWGFWFWAIGCLVLSLATFVIVPHRIGSPIPALSLRQFDYIGSLLGVSALILFSFAWSQASVVGWQEPYIYALLIVSVFLLVGFVFSQSCVSALLPQFPLDPPWLCARGRRYGIWLDTQPLAAVAQMVPLVIGGMFATMAVGLFIAKTPAQYIFGVSMFSFFIGNLLMSFVNYSNVYWAFIFPACLLVVGGPDLSFASSGILISNAVLPEEQGVAGSFISTVVLYSISIGLGIAATVESHVNEGGQNLIRGYRGAFWLGIGFAAVGFFIVIFFVRDPRFESKAEDQSGPEAITERADL
ncbi:Major facilitator superfamily domain general substrate transporter [Penicillium expansum]|nr:Major facilitator superfamily domain general substrate transporter [Penicillium expansum]